MNRTISVILAILAFSPCAARAQDMQMPTTDCATKAPLPPGLAAWASKQTLSSAEQPAGLDRASLAPGHAATVTLHPTPKIGFVRPPQKPNGSDTQGGMLAVVVAATGNYQVSLSTGAWIDMLKDGAEISSTAHTPGPACTGIRKMVQFPLHAGRYVLQISGNPNPSIDVMVSKAP